MLLLQAFNEDKVPADASHVQPVLDILHSFPGHASPRCTELTPDLCSRYSLEALKWLRQQQPGGAGARAAQAACQQIHLHLADYLTSCYGPSGLGWASPHFALGHDPAAFARAVAAAVQAGSGADEQLFLVRAALQVMASSPDIGQAQSECRLFLDTYRGCRGSQLPSHPLVSCLKLLMLVRPLLLACIVPMSGAYGSRTRAAAFGDVAPDPAQSPWAACCC